MRVRSLGTILRQTTITLVAPPRCVRCLISGTWLCQTCWRQSARLTYRPPCLLCKTTRGRSGRICPQCRARTPLLGVQSVGPYASPWLQRGVSWLKFRGIRDVAPALAHLLLLRLPAIGPLEQLQTQAMLIPIPLHRRRLRNRGYNQSAELAHYLSRLSGIPYLNALERIRPTWSQAHLPADLRQENVAGGFQLTHALPTNISMAIIIDDVTTSGSTLSAAAEPVAAAGIQQIWGLTLARG